MTSPSTSGGAFKIKQGDRARQLRVRCVDAAGKPKPLTGSAIRFRMEPDIEGLRDAVEGPAALLDPAESEVGYAWQPGDTDVDGLYKGEFRVTYGDGTSETFPGEGHIDIVIERRLAQRRVKAVQDRGATVTDTATRI